MELRQLRYFVAVADTLNFSRASESLYVSQSALSKQVAELEQELGVLLLERDKRSVRLTRAGELLLPEAKAILMQSEKIVPLLRHEAEEATADRSIHIGVETRAEDDPVVHRLLTDGVYRLRRRTPGLRALFWQYDSAELKKALQDGTLDLGVFLHTAPDLGDALETEVLREDEMVLVLRSEHDYPDERAAILDLLAKRGVILVEREPRGQAQILSILDGIGSAPQIRFCRDKTAMILTMESGESTAILPESLARRLPGEDLRILRFHHPAAKLYLLAGWRGSADSALPRRIARETAREAEARGYRRR